MRKGMVAVFMLILSLVPGDDSALWVRAGDHYLTRVVWVREIPETPGIFDVGSAFIERESCREDVLATFTELLNLSVLEKLPAGIAAN